MTRFVLRRAGFALAILFVVSILVFIATELLPGNVALAILGRSATPARLRALDLQLHLSNASPPLQYLSWLGGLVTGHLGHSLASGAPVTQVLGGRLVNTGFLVGVSAVVALPLGVVLGVVSAAFRDRFTDNALTAAMIALAAIPDFILGLLLVICFSTVVWQVLPGTANLAPGEAPWDNLTGIVLPALTLTLAVVPYIARITRTTMVDALASEYVEFARLRGLTRTQVILRHALPNALAPVAQAGAISLSYLAGGAVLIEYIFAYPGIGQGLVYAVQERDVPIIQVTTVLLAALYVTLNFVADVMTVLLTPRVRTAIV